MSDWRVIDRAKLRMATERSVARLRPIGRASLAMADVQAADAVARTWGEAVWTDPLHWRMACIDAARRMPFPFVAVGRPVQPSQREWEHA